MRTSPLPKHCQTWAVRFCENLCLRLGERKQVWWQRHTGLFTLGGTRNKGKARVGLAERFSRHRRLWKRQRPLHSPESRGRILQPARNKKRRSDSARSETVDRGLLVTRMSAPLDEEYKTLYEENAYRRQSTKEVGSKTRFFVGGCSAALHFWP